jgi:hypothetical protein
MTEYGEGIARICLFDCLSRRELSGFFNYPQEDRPETDCSLLVFFPCNPCFLTSFLL